MELNWKKAHLTFDSPIFLIRVKNMLNKNDILFFYSTISRLSKTKNLPVDIMIEVTNACNLHCVMCREHPTLNNKAVTLNVNSKIKKGLNSALKSAKQLGIFGFGEPLLFPDYGYFIKELRVMNPKICMGITTNGQLLTPALIEQIIDAKIDAVVFSIDSADPKTYESIRRGASFFRLKKNLELFDEIKVKRNTSNPVLVIEVVLMKNNIDQLLDILEFARARKFSAIILEWVREFPDLLVTDYSPYADTINEFFVRARKYGIGIDGPFIRHRPDLYPKYVNKENGKILRKNKFVKTDSRFSLPPMKCLHPWHSCFITSNGDVLPCCGEFILHPGEHTFSGGNLNENSFEEIWNGEPFRNLRKSIASGNYIPVCKKCIVNGSSPTLVMAYRYPKLMKSIIDLRLLPKM